MLADAAGLPKVWLAPPDLVLEATGFPAGGVAPRGHKQAIPVVIDRRVMNEAVVYGGAGSEDGLLRIAPSGIARVTAAIVAGIVETPRT